MKLSTIVVASLLFLAVAGVASEAVPAPVTCTIGDGVCTQKLHNGDGRWTVAGNPSTRYGLIVEEEQISDSCAIQAGIPLNAKPANTRYTFDFEEAAGTSVYATMDEATGTLTISGIVSGGPVKGYFGDAGYDGSKIACAAENGLYKLSYTARGFVKQADGSYKMTDPYTLDSNGNKIANGEGTVTQITANGNGRSFALGIQNHFGQLYSFWFLKAGSPLKQGSAWVDTIGPGGPGSKTGKSRDFIFTVDATCTCTPTDPGTECEVGDNVCAQKLYNNRNGKWFVPSKPETAYGFIVEDEQISDECANQAQIPLASKPVNTRYVFDFNHHMGTGVTAVIDEVAGTLTITGTVYGGPVIGHYSDAGYTGAKYGCTADVGLYALTYVATHMVKQADGSFIMVLPYHLDANGNKIANGAGTVTKIGGGPSFVLGIQDHPVQQYAFLYGKFGLPRSSGIAWVDTIGPGGPGSKTGKSRDFNFEIGVDCNCDPTDPSSECETLVADEDCTHVVAHSDGNCVCVTFTADGALVTVPCA